MRMGRPSAPDPLGRSCPLQSPPDLKRIRSPGWNVIAFTGANDFQAVSGERPSFESVPKPASTWKIRPTAGVDGGSTALAHAPASMSIRRMFNTWTITVWFSSQIMFLPMLLGREHAEIPTVLPFEEWKAIRFELDGQPDVATIYRVTWVPAIRHEDEGVFLALDRQHERGL